MPSLIRLWKLILTALPSCSELAPCPYLDTFWNPGQVLETTSEGMSEFYSESVEKKICSVNENVREYFNLRGPY